MKEDIRADIFNRNHPIYTKVRDEAPAFYSETSSVSDCIVADGCTVAGKVEGSVIFRDVTIDEGASVKNSIIMQDSVISENVKLNCVIMDKNTVITPKKVLSGDKSYPLFVGKHIVI